MPAAIPAADPALAQGQSRLMERKLFFTHVEWLLGAPAGSLNGSERLGAIPGWDSLMVLGIISLADEQGVTSVLPDQIHLALTLNDVHRLLFGGQ